uniref:Uncharacterized protein n=2 Tax=Avena sativa TaxID=4498 RepID=A0ACD5X6J7_AVESA
MSSQPPPSPQPPPPPPRAPTAVTGLGDDLLREIFLRLPDLPSLVRAAFACRAFRRAVRSSPAFRRSFRALHAPPLLALFLEPNFEVVPVFPCSWRRSDPDLVAADFFDIRLSRHGDADATGWEIHSKNPSNDGYFILDKVGAAGIKRRAAYNPLTQALDVFLYQPEVDIDLQFYTLSSENGHGPSRVVCVRHHRRRGERVTVFSSDTMEWKFFPNNTPPLREPGFTTGTVMRGLIWWQNLMYDQIVVLHTSTFHFSLIDVPTPLMTEWDESTYKLGETNDEKLCIVDIKDNTLVSFLLTAGDDDSVVERWVLYKEFPLDPIVNNTTGCSMEEDDCQVRVQLVAVIDGFIYLSIFYCKDAQSSELYLSLCLETSEMSELFKDTYRYNQEVHPYVMPWPPSLLQTKEDSETEFTSDSVVDDGPVCTEKASSVLIAALQSLSQALMDGNDSNKEIVADLDAFLLDTTKKTVAELDVFLRPNEDGEGSLMSKIASFDAQLVTARDRILRISA